MPLAPDLGREILRDLTGAPPGDLEAVLAAVPAGFAARTGPGAVPGIALAPTGLGTSAARAFRSRPDATPRPAAAHPAWGVPRPAQPWSVSRPVAPRLFCPGPLRDDHALGEQVNDAIVGWAEQVGIYRGRLDRLRAANFGRFMMLTHPATSDPDRLLAAAKCVVAEWAADDYYVDEVSLGADPSVVGSRLANLHALVDPAPLPHGYAAQLAEHHRLRPVSMAFRGAVEHLTRYASVTQLARFRHQMAILFLAWTQEADWHVNRRTPPVWEYLVQRHLNSYLPPMLLVDVLAGYELPPQEYDHPRVRRAFTTAGSAAVLVNDLYSARNESGADHNLPSVLVAGEGLTPREAVLRTVEIHNELMRTFVTLAAELAASGSPPLRRFLADTWAWLGGSREWHATSGRYHPSEQGEKS
ncbi:family 2 encapsulin nanocompartment cargo protein terpene cyclase [Actinoplanes teichomyceticus]|uniref:2-methylisoborneol synthase n=1 Tax=Actinoplanes teichomyceticus TaxID=1867 RepID=A0A561WJU4_ACTTI|nr:family 2 encapsulin nanocompartment cargo protein terpene cyclase [Actinoplanes teichomyceticus]TWG24125.1 2-methylisoborneol synthase [Actinoplanes teichomyceticus]GIF12165.1 terpene synthase [Actinoplanes teichomyceticus]